MKGRDYLGNKGVFQILNKLLRIYCVKFSRSEYGDNELLGSIKYKQFLDKRIDFQLLNNVSAALK
jgi:hypothetical protein